MQVTVTRCLVSRAERTQLTSFKPEKIAQIIASSTYLTVTMKGWLPLLLLFLIYFDSSFMVIALSASKFSAANRQRRSTFPAIQKALHPLDHYAERLSKDSLDYYNLHRTKELYNARDIGVRSQSKTKSPLDFGDLHSVLISLRALCRNHYPILPISNILRQHEISMTTAIEESISMGYRLYSKIATSLQIDDIHMHDLLQFIASCRRIPFLKIYLNPWIITLRRDLNSIHSKNTTVIPPDCIH